MGRISEAIRNAIFGDNELTRSSAVMELVEFSALVGCGEVKEHDDNSVCIEFEESFYDKNLAQYLEDANE